MEKKFDKLCQYIEWALPSSGYKLVKNYVDNDHRAVITTIEGPYCIIYEQGKSEKDKSFLDSVKAKMRNEKIRFAIIVNKSSVLDSIKIKMCNENINYAIIICKTKDLELINKIRNKQMGFTIISKRYEEYCFLESNFNIDRKLEFKEITESKELNEKVKQQITKMIPNQNNKCDKELISYNKELISKYFKDNFWLDVKNEEIMLDSEKKECSIEDKKELKLIRKIFNLQSFSGTVYRYIPLKGLFDTLKSGNIHMSGIAGMNDVSEVDYVEKMLYDGASPLDPEIGKVYIMSCSINKEDDLTQWRLYGDDGKGACLTFKVKDEVKNEEKKFIFQKIKYINDGGYYKPLKQLKELIKYVRQVTGYTFVFKSFHDWSHFIKPKDYEVESEARVLYHVKDKNENKHKPENWIFTNRNIANPYADIPLDEEEFPLELVEIKLGPKCPEFETNKSQLEALIKENDQIKNKKIIISKSKIEHYR